MTQIVDIAPKRIVEPDGTPLDVFSLPRTNPAGPDAGTVI